MQSQKDNSDTPDLLRLRPIGTLQSDFSFKFGTPRQGALAPASSGRLTLAPEWRGKGMFSGLEGFSHVWLLSWFNQNKNTKQAGKIHPPRLLGEAIGVFASRSPHRPNAIGLTLARLEKIETDQLLLSGVDLVNNTPILDIKPYLAEADRPAEFTTGWPSRLDASETRCIFSAEAEADLLQLTSNGRIADMPRFMDLIQQVLLLDPRPLAYRARVNERFAIVIAGQDVHARFANETFTVLGIKPFAGAAKGQTQSS